MKKSIKIKNCIHNIIKIIFLCENKIFFNKTIAFLNSMIYFYDMIEKKSNEIKNQAVAVSAIAIDIAKAEQEKLNDNGIRMSLGAIVSKAVVENYGKK